MAYKTITPQQLINKFQFALKEKWGYIWGTAGVMWTEKKQISIEKTSDQNRLTARTYGRKWIGHTVADCSGLFSWAFKSLGSYMYHGSNTMWRKYCTAQGDLKSGKRTDGQPLKPGTAVFTDHSGDKTHVGLYIGNGDVIEAANTQKGVIVSKASNSKWKCWGELKYVVYESCGTEENDVTIPVSYPTLRRGMRSDIVYQMQVLLQKDGSALEVDGIFGIGTLSAVKAFQKRHGLVVDGIVGPKTWKELLKLA